MCGFCIPAMDSMQSIKYFALCRGKILFLGFLMKVTIFGEEFDFRPKFSILGQNFFGQHFDFWPTFRFLNRISILEQKFDF